MGLWLLGPMKRKNSSDHPFVQRMPADVRPRRVDATLEVPLGDDFAPVSISESAQASPRLYRRGTSSSASSTGPKMRGLASRHDRRPENLLAALKLAAVRIRINAL
ncbi:hypothetical protein [Ancylobacter sp.]|uniref:hypothetical protein n=1 Tax=Ancylobacter sp. TaxID=1872567 RepID=UPI003C7A8276